MHYYDLCCRYHGKVVNITDKHGHRHIGKITQVTQTHVFIEPEGYSPRFGGISYGYYGGYGYRPGIGYPIALGAIAGLALAGLFFW